MNIVLVKSHPSDRVKKAIERVLNAKPPQICMEKAKIMTEVYSYTEGEPKVLRQAKAFLEYCKRKTIFINEGELIIGHPASKVGAAVFAPDTHYWILSEEAELISARSHTRFVLTDTDRELFRKEIEPFWKGKTFWDIWDKTAPEDLKLLNELGIVCILSGRDQAGHGLFIPNYPLVLKEGLAGIKERVKSTLGNLDMTMPDGWEKFCYLKSLLLCLEGIRILAERYAELANSLADAEEDLVRREELRTLARICKKVPWEPAGSFHEALQALWLYHVAIMMEYPAASVNLGRIDRYLYPYFLNDIHTGVIDYDTALELLECLWVKFAEINYLVDESYSNFVPGYARFQNVVCGGVDEHGEDAVNELSYLMLQATMDVKLPQPNLCVKVHKKTNESFLHKVGELVKIGIGQPQIYNDEVGCETLVQMGIPVEEAIDWSVLSCKDVGLMGKIGSPRVPVGLNLGAVLELVLTRGKHRKTGVCVPMPEVKAPHECVSWEDFFETCKVTFAFFIKKAAEMATIVEEILSKNYPALLVSLSFESCIDKAKDCCCGGAKYNPAGEIVVVGHADLINSLAAIRSLVYEQKVVTWERLLQALDTDFIKDEEIRRLCLKAPKYGNDDYRTDMLGAEVFSFMGKEARKYEGFYGGNRILVGTAAAFHLYAGYVVGALPSGRKAWAPLADGISPMQGTDCNGLTAVLHSASRCALHVYRSPLLNVKLDPLFFENGTQNFVGLIRSWHQLGLYHIQFNVISPDILRKAQEKPEEYKGLIVRVSGYCAYFVDLPKEVQDEIISRTTFTGC